ncbi:MAG: hypothetical protein ACJAUP_000399 [Cellvibrionaceae bacterium]|jgi:hypothetical protein
MVIEARVNRHPLQVYGWQKIVSTYVETNVALSAGTLPIALNLEIADGSRKASQTACAIQPFLFNAIIATRPMGKISILLPLPMKEYAHLKKPYDVNRD